MLKKIISFVLSFSLITSQPIFAQGVAQINLGNYLRTVGSSMAMDKFRPLHMRYFSYDMATDNFQLLLDKGDNKDIKEVELEEKTKVLMDYFKIGLSLPNEKFWVNLRPDAQDQIIDPELEKTDIGKIMLEADLQLKKDTAGLTSPQNPEGKAYWDKLYKKAGELFGSENITIPTITRPWIVPGEIILRQGEDSAYIFKANMKVMLESDYISSQPSAISSQQYNFKDPRMKELNEYSSQLIRELIIPRLTKEVNTSKRYAPLRQVFFSLVMARWFKDTFGSSGSASAPGTRAPDSSYVKLINSGDLTNLTSQESWSKTYYFNEYKKSFEKGEYNLKEDIVTPTGQVIRSYVSGGISGSPLNLNRFTIPEGGLRDSLLTKIRVWSIKGLVLSQYVIPITLMLKAGGQVLFYGDHKGFHESFTLAIVSLLCVELIKVIIYSLDKFIPPSQTKEAHIDKETFSNLHSAVKNMGKFEFSTERYTIRLKTPIEKGEINFIIEKKNKKWYEKLGLPIRIKIGEDKITLTSDVSIFTSNEVLRDEINAIMQEIVARINEKLKNDDQAGQATGSNTGYDFVKGMDIKSKPVGDFKDIPPKPSIVSSAVGGIDFRAMNYLVQPMGSFKDLQFSLPILTSSALERINLDEELEKLRDMVKNGFVPSGARVKEYLAACFQKGKIEEKQDDLLVCLAEIYRLAEEENLETSPELRESLVIVDTGKFVLLPNNQRVGLN